jgi:hypothetical protein
VARNAIEEREVADFGSWVVAHRGRLCPDSSGVVYYEIPLEELRQQT